MKKNLIISLAILLAVSASGAGSYVYAKMSPEAYKLFQETTVLEKENNYANVKGGLRSTLFVGKKTKGDRI